jgi:adenosylmethionine-8-amino-7-oxononanoate aminotransferase
VRGRGFLLGVELVDPRDGESFLPREVEISTLVDGTALEHGLLVTTSSCAADGFSPDQTLFAPAYVATDTELAEMVDRLAATLGDADSRIKSALA